MCLFDVSVCMNTIQLCCSNILGNLQKIRVRSLFGGILQGLTRIKDPRWATVTGLTQAFVCFSSLTGLTQTLVCLSAHGRADANFQDVQKTWPWTSRLPDRVPQAEISLLLGRSPGASSESMHREVLWIQFASAAFRAVELL